MLFRTRNNRETGSSGAEGGPGKRASRNAGTAPRSDPYTKLRGPLRGVWYDLYVMLDIFSRYVLGWRVEETETGELAAEFLDDVIRTYGKPTAVHADRGTSMTSKNVARRCCIRG